MNEAENIYRERQYKELTAEIKSLRAQLARARDKAIDDCIDWFGEHYSEKGDDGSYETWTTFEVQKELECLKRAKDAGVI